MKPTSEEKFVWYADHDKVGSLIFVTLKKNARYAFIYAPRMIFERLGKRCNLLYSVELNLGPMGHVPRHYYEETGITVQLPWRIQLLVAHEIFREKENRDNDNHTMEDGNDTILTKFILDSWNNWDAAKSLH